MENNKKKIPMKEHIEILERALSQSQKTLQGAGEEIKRLDRLIEEQKTTIKVLASMVGGQNNG